MLKMEQSYELKFEKKFKDEIEMFTFLKELYKNGGEVAQSMHPFIMEDRSLSNKYDIFSKAYEAEKKVKEKG